MWRTVVDESRTPFVEMQANGATTPSANGSTGHGLHSGGPARPLIVDAQQLWFRYPSSEMPALKGVDLIVRQGQCIGVVGPSGAGKSTLCQILKGIIPHSSPGELEGTVSVFGADITVPEQLAAISKRVAFVLQDPEAQIIGMTVAEDLAYGPENYEEDPDEIRERSTRCLHQVGLSPALLGRDTYALSGGEKQRLAIASALMLEPELLILDEPTSELDPIGKEQVFNVLAALRDHADVTLIIVEHEIERLVQIADWIVVLQDGRVVTEGTPIEVFTGDDVLVRTAGERLPAAAALYLALGRNRGLIPGLQATLDLDAILGVIANGLGGGS
jgi:energy-coupling factor transporter ATP-binding protein EcfA2